MAAVRDFVMLGQERPPREDQFKAQSLTAFFAVRRAAFLLCASHRAARHAAQRPRGKATQRRLVLASTACSSLRWPRRPRRPQAPSPPSAPPSARLLRAHIPPRLAQADRPSRRRHLAASISQRMDRMDRLPHYTPHPLCHPGRMAPRLVLDLVQTRS